MVSVFSYRHYGDFLQDWLKSQPQGGRGLKLRLAKQTGMQPSFLSGVLKGRMHLSHDQGFQLATAMALPEAETRFFLLLLQKERAALPGLRKHLEKEIEAELSRSQNLADRLKGARILDEAGMQEYFSSWIYGAIHLCCLMEPWQFPESIALRLGLDIKVVSEILWKLEQMGMVEKGKRGYESGKTQLHLPKSSPYLRQHQMNLKAKSQEMVQKGAEGMQYISLISISQADYKKIYEELVQVLNRTRPIIDASPAEDLYIFNIDFARLV